MKILALALTMMMGHALADVPEIMAHQVTCEQLKAEIKNYGSAVVIKKILGFKKRVYVNHSEACSDDETKKYGVFKTKDVKKCYAGEWCKYTPSYSGGYYDSGSSYDSGYSSGSSYDSGSSSSGSNYGNSYNPPSSGTRGDSYDPPSSGTRGSRYCPGC